MMTIPQTKTASPRRTRWEAEDVCLSDKERATTVAIPNDVHKLLQVISPDHDKYAIFANAKYDPATKKLGTWRHFRDVRQLDDTRDCFLSAASFPDDGIAERTGVRVVEVHALVIDDVGSEQVPAADVLKGLGPPTFEVLTSANSAHWWYRLKQPVPAAEWPDFFEEIERRVGHDLDGAEAHHVFRLPMGVNTKPKRSGFKPCFGQVNPGITLDAAAIMLFAPPKPARASSRGGGGWLRDIEEVARLVPNPDSLLRKAWVDNAYRFRALAVDSDAAWRAFELWSKKNEYWYDGDDTEKLWRQDLKPEATSGRELLVDAMIANPEGYQVLMSREARAAFDDGVIHPEVPKGKGITATPFKWMNLADTEPRDWLYGDILLRKFISMTVAPGGTGKSSLVAVETLAQITGRNLLGEELPAGELRVWLWNLEDTYGETQKKLLAAAKHYGISEADIGDRLFVDSGREQKLVVAVTERNAPMIVRPVIRALVEQIKLRKIDIIVVDPFVSCHEVPENDNGAMDMVVKEWGLVAELGNCAVHLVDHTSKAGSKEVVTDSSRGAKAKTDAARVVRVVNRMTDTDGKTYGITETWRYFNTFNDKANMAPPKARRDWFKMESMWAGNGANAARAFSVGAAANTLGDSMGVAVQWTPPNAKAMATGDTYTKVVEAMGTKRWRVSPHSPDWIGNAVAQGCGLLPHSTVDRLSVKQLIKTWISEGLFKIVRQLDEKRNMREYIEIAQVY